VVKGKGPLAPGWAHTAVVGGLVAGLVSNLVIALLRAYVVLFWFLLVSRLSGSRHSPAARTALRLLWVVLKIFAYPFVGERSTNEGFDASIVLLGVGAELVFAISSGILFGLVAHGRSRKRTVAIGLLFGILLWVVDSTLMFSPLGEAVPNLGLFIPYGLALAYTFLWYQRRFYRGDAQ
jgi:hypothetical protein